MANEFKDRVLAVNREYQSEDEVSPFLRRGEIVI